MSEPTTRINVTKAQLMLAKDESLGQFSSALRAAACEMIQNQLGLGEKAYVWVSDIFDDVVVISVDRGMDERRNDLYQVPYTRKGTGFVFGKMLPVLRRIIYVPKEVTEVVAKSFWSNAL